MSSIDSEIKKWIAQSTLYCAIENYMDAYEELCSKLPSKQEDRTEGKEKDISSDGNGCCTKIC